MLIEIVSFQNRNERYVFYLMQRYKKVDGYGVGRTYYFWRLIFVNIFPPLLRTVCQVPCGIVGSKNPRTWFRALFVLQKYPCFNFTPCYDATDEYFYRSNGIARTDTDVS
ncbi:hypothetical protein CJ232_02730 [Hoylesella timonensis]|uniref:Uncharacterized protein n=1 Tax=Hoylesella timonensis TaxID=386414 RepID=A0A2N6Q7N4_9BACT|nr:hypothetical protein CJ232_02730 [Hoylesella timonensis]